MGAITIREATLADAAALAALVTELGYPTRPAEMSQRLDGIVGDPTYAAFVAEDESALMGLGGATLGRYFEKNGLYARLVILVVAETNRGAGVGEALVQAVEHWACSRSARELLVNSGTRRQGAHRFYQRCGFRITGVRLVKELEVNGRGNS